MSSVTRYIRSLVSRLRPTTDRPHPPTSMKVGAISKFREGIAAKFALFFSLLVLLATGTVGFLVYQGAEESLIDASTDRLKHTAEVVSVRLEASVEAIAKDLRFLVSTPPVQGLVRAHVEGPRVRDAHRNRTFIDPETNIDDREWRGQVANTLTVFLENRPSYVQASFIALTERGGFEITRIEKRDGQVVRVPMDSLRSRLQDEAFRKAVGLDEDAFHLSDITLSPASAGRPPEPVVRAIMPVYASNERVYGAVVIHVNMGATFDAFDSLVDENVSLHLANGQGEMLTASSEESFETQFPGAADWFRSRRTAWLTLNIERPGMPEKKAYFERIAFGMGPNQHYLVAGITSPYEAILARVERVRTYSLLITLFFGVIGIGLALAFSGYLTYPLRQVTQALSRFGRDSEEPRVAMNLPTRRRDEIGVLARTFDAMTRQIKRQMHEVADKERRQRIILETSAEGIIVVTDDGAIETFNQTAETLLGRTAEAVEGTSVDELLAVPGDMPATEDDPEWLPPWKQVGSGREVNGRRADGSEVPMSLAVSAFELFGEQKYALFLQDISERKRYERILQDAKEKAEEVAQLKSTFLANMSHEIRTPLTTVIGYAGVLAEEASDKHREFAQFIRNSGERLMETLNSVLSMAQLEASGVEIQLDVLDVTDEAREIASLFKPLADEKELALRFQAPPEPDGPLMAHLDRGALSSILQNLIGNAVKFTEDGSVTVRVSYDTDEVHLHVADTGIGIDPDFVPHLFDEFVQESTGVRRSHEGSGLGLAITKRLVDLMNGRIAVESAKGEGTEFTVSFPRAEVVPEVAEDAVRDAPAAASGHPEVAPRLLLVEDNAETASLMQELLHKRYDVTAVSDGESALREAQEHTFDMVLLDINLGGDPSGADVLRRLRAQPAYEDVPIAAVTAYALPGDRDRLLNIGFDAYLDKPFAPEDLAALVQQLRDEAASGRRHTREARPRSRTPASGDLTAPSDRP